MANASDSAPGFKYSLKLMLIGFIAVGVVAGVLGRLYFKNLELFMMLVSLLTTVVPFLLAIATIIWLGARKSSRRKGLVVWGLILLVTPAVGIGSMLLVQVRVGPGMTNMSTLPTQQVIRQELPKQIDEPWVWNELENRLGNGSLTPQEVDEAINQLTKHMKTTKPQGWDQPLSWQRDFVEAARIDKKMSDEVLLDLCDAFFGTQARVDPLPRVREGANDISIQVEYGSTWSNNSGLGIVLLWNVKQALLDGQPLEVQRRYQNNREWSGQLKGDLDAGKHEITFELECAYVDEDKLIGLNRNDLPPELWPPSRKFWKQTVTAQLSVFGQQTSIVGLIKDPESSPGKNGGVVVERFVMQPEKDDRKHLILRLTYPGPLPTPISYDVAVEMDGQTIELGSAWAIQTATQDSHGGSSLDARMDDLDPTITSANIILRPNPKHIERQPNVEAVWGGGTILRNVPIERLDLEAGQDAKGS